MRRLALLPLLCSSASACPQALECGPGTLERDGVCLPADEAPTFPPGDDDDDDTPAPPPDPGYPEYPDVVDQLSISIRTGDGVFDGTDENDLDVCLKATSCYHLNVADVDDFRVGEIDVYHWEGVGLPRADVDRVEFRSTNGQDRWNPACMEISFDGEPVYCRDSIGIGLGDGGDEELISWVDPEGLGLHGTCLSCWDQPLTHGPMVGAVGPEDARIWLRTDATRRVGVHLAPADAGAPVDAPVAAWLYPTPSRDFTAVATLTGLLPSTPYVYWLDVEGVAMPGTFSFRTAPPLGEPSDLRIAFGSCTKDDAQPIFADIDAVAAPDLFFFIGDNHYGNTSVLDALRWNYRWSLERPQRAAMLTHTSTLATWDDHDFVGNNTDGFEPGRDVAARAFEEYWANPAYGTATTPGIFFRHAWGDVDLFFVDDRYWRGWDDSLLGEAQTAWLESELLASTATWKVLVCGSQWTPHGSSDSWAAFDSAREQLFDFIRDSSIDGVVVLSGDIHRSEFRLIERASDGGYDIPELTSSPLANNNSVCQDEPDVVDCWDDGDFYLTMDFDSAAAEPALLVSAWDGAGALRGEMTVLRSDLLVP
jgi:alkaline phosphatase D